MSRNYAKVLAYYQRWLRGEPGGWDKARVRALVGLPTGITAAEYEKITGEPYDAPVTVNNSEE